MENEPYLDLTVGTGGDTSQYQDDDDDDDDVYNDSSQDGATATPNHGFSRFLDNNDHNPFDPYSTTTSLGMSDDNYGDDDDVEMDSPSQPNSSNVHHGGMFHYDHQQNASQSSNGNAVEEHTGRWTKEEHDAFLQGLQKFGKEWKKVAAHVRTRTVVQTRTHAQKYFQKLQKSIQDSQKLRRNANSSDYDDMRDELQHDDETARMIAIMNSANPPDDDDPVQSFNVTTGSGARGRSTRGGRGGRRGQSSTSLGSTKNITSTSKKSGIGVHQLQPLLQPPPVSASKGSLKSTFTVTTGNALSASHQQHRRGSTATLNAAQVISQLSAAKTTGTTFASINHTQQSHPIVTAVSSSHSLQATPSRGQASYFINNNNSNMKIVAPDPSNVGRLYPFPEPSPAATGKRKLMEIAAAQTLVGVISSNSKHPPPVTTATAGAAPSVSKVDYMQLDGPPTPPISSNYTNDSVNSSANRPLHLSEAPPLPPLVSGNNSGTISRPTLQIVNPDVFGILPPSHRNANGRTSPVTPWDSELDALIGSTASTAGLDDIVDETDENGFDEVTNLANGTDTSMGPPQQLDQLDKEKFLHPIFSPVDGYSRTPLHQAVCAQDVETVKTLIDVIGTQSKDLNQFDTAGYTPLHSACASPSAAAISSNDAHDDEEDEKTNQMVRILLKAGCNPFLEDSSGNTPLHWAVRACSYDATQQLLNCVSQQFDIVENNNDDTTTNCFMFKHSTDCKSIGQYLNKQNQQGESCMHWAARGGLRCCRSLVPLLLSYSVKSDLMNKAMKRPIDVVVEGFIDEPNSLASMRIKNARNSKGQPNNVDGKNKSIESKELTDLIQKLLPDIIATRLFLLQHIPMLRTLVLHHPECLDHHPKSLSDWETPDRVKTILQRLNDASTEAKANNNGNGVLSHEIVLSQDFDRGNLELLSRVHSTEYLSFVNQLSKELERKIASDPSGDGDPNNTSTNITKWGLPISSSALPVVPFTPMVQRSMIKIAESSVKLSDNSDTSFSVGSLRAARRAAGAVQHAIDSVMKGTCRNSFCIVRPPGHHAGVNGLLEGGESCGFCIFNNVAAGAMHALAEYKEVCQRVAIVDIDVHHGNGTEEIVRKCNDPSTLFFFSIHLFDNDELMAPTKKKNHLTYKFYPGTGHNDDLALNIINVPIMPLWKDALSKSSSVEPKTHNTRKKLRSSTSASTGTENDDSSDTGTPRTVQTGALSSSRYSDGESSTATTTNPMQQQSAPNVVPMTTSVGGTILTLPGRMAYRQAIQSRLLPSLRAFNPNLILISTGFDATRGDVGNARHEKDRERMGIDLSPDDYAWTTRQILQIADICCNGRVVSILEGGYGRTPLAETSERTTTLPGTKSSTLDRKVFGDCAIRHLHALIDPYDVERRFG